MKTVTTCLLASVLAIAGCLSPEQIAANRQAQWEAQQAQQRAYTEGLAQQCQGIGYKRDTDPFRDCVLRLHTQNQATRAAIGAAIIQSQPQPSQTVCGRDYLGRVVCNTR